MSDPLHDSSRDNAVIFAQSRFRNRRAIPALTQSEVVPLLVQRTEVGLTRYPEPLTTWNGRRGDVDVVEELLDAYQYSLFNREERRDLETEIVALRRVAREAAGLLGRPGESVLPQDRRAALAQSLLDAAEVRVPYMTLVVEDADGHRPA